LAFSVGLLALLPGCGWFSSSSSGSSAAASQACPTAAVFRPLSQTAVFGTQGRRPLDVAFYGRLSTLKGLDTFLRAAALALDDPVFARWLGRFVVIGPEDKATMALSPGELRGLIPKEPVPATPNSSTRLAAWKAPQT